MGLSAHAHGSMDIHGSLGRLPAVNHSDPRPAYRQVADTLRGWIVTLPAGTRLPTQAAIKYHFKVSPGAGNAAIRLLKQDGLIDTARGVGMFVAASKRDLTAKDSLVNLAQQIAEAAAELAERLAGMTAYDIGVLSPTAGKFDGTLGS